MESLDHFPFIAGSYGLAGVILLGMAIWVRRRGKSAARQLAEIEAARGSRRTRRAAHTKPELSQ